MDSIKLKEITAIFNEHYVLMDQAQSDAAKTALVLFYSDIVEAVCDKVMEDGNDEQDSQ